MSRASSDAATHRPPVFLSPPVPPTPVDDDSSFSDALAAAAAPGQYADASNGQDSYLTPASSPGLLASLPRTRSTSSFSSFSNGSGSTSLDSEDECTGRENIELQLNGLHPTSATPSLHHKTSSSSLSIITNSSRARRTSFRDKVASKLHEHLPSLSISGRVSAKILNQTPYPLEVVPWPCKVNFEDVNTEGESSDLQMSHYRGAPWEDEVIEAHAQIPARQSEGEKPVLVELGSMRKAHSLQSHTHSGWIAFDLKKPDGEAIHLQLYLHLSRKGIKHHTSLGRLDLDSTKENPQPSGKVGKTLFTKTGDDIVYIITPDVADITNAVDDSTKEPSKLLFGKGVETTSYVHHRGCRVSLFVGREARYHEPPTHLPTLGEMRHTTVRTGKQAPSRQLEQPAEERVFSCSMKSKAQCPSL